MRVWAGTDRFSVSVVVAVVARVFVEEKISEMDTLSPEAKTYWFDGRAFGLEKPGARGR